MTVRDEFFLRGDVLSAPVDGLSRFAVERADFELRCARVESVPVEGKEFAGTRGVLVNVLGVEVAPAANKADRAA